MTNKQRQAQQRNAKRSSRSRKRRGQYLHAKHTRNKLKKQMVTKKLNAGKLPLKTRINIIIRHTKDFILKKVFCRFNIHDWKLCSGREGQSMKTCFRCYKMSEEKWGKGGSENYYEDKYGLQFAELKGVQRPENWTTDGDNWYYKGEFIDMPAKGIKNLKRLLGKEGVKEVIKRSKKEVSEK